MEKSIDNVDIIIEKYLHKKASAPVRNVHVELRTEKRGYRVTRLKDDQVRLLRHNRVPIFEDYNHLLFLYYDKNVIYSNLAKMYITLKSCFGESSHFYDDWKASFSFPFLIAFTEDGDNFEYLMNVFNWRSSIEFSFFKLVKENNDDYAGNAYCDPFEEFSRSEINFFIDSFVEYLTRCFEVLKNRYDEFFFQVVESNRIVFGYSSGEYFSREYDDEEEFHEVVQKLNETRARNIESKR